MTYGMVINLKKCVGCFACVTVCKGANGTPPGVLRSKVLRETEGTYPNVERTITPVQCMQCEKPACVAACPTGASQKGEDGIVTIDKSECIGCKSCIEACPYDVRTLCVGTDGYAGAELNAFEEVKYAAMPENTVDKCDFCKGNGKLDAGEQPACVKACITGARIFGDLDDLQDLINDRNAYQLLPEQGTNPSIWYIGNYKN